MPRSAPRPRISPGVYDRAIKPTCRARLHARGLARESMIVQLTPHAARRLLERGATEAEVVATVENGERFPAKHGRTGFRRNFLFAGLWRGRPYANSN